MPAISLAAALTHLLARTDVPWSIGRQGAIAEFTRDPDEPAAIEGLTVATGRGGILMRADDPARLLAWEELGSRRGDWVQRIALCLPCETARAPSGATHSVVTELGPDAASLRPQDREGVLFDLGVGGPWVIVAVRTADAALSGMLRTACGTALLDNDPLIHALVATSPHRVFISRLGRIEVYQPIARPGGAAPDGPHTHLLPSLLAQPDPPPTGLPEGWVACITGYPAHPQRDEHGRARPFSLAAHDHFQALLSCHGDPRYLEIKDAVREALRAGCPPSDFPVHEHQRTAALVTLRQFALTEGESAQLARWRAAFEATPVD